MPESLIQKLWTMLYAPQYCIRPSTMTLYKMLREIPKIQGWEHGYVRIAGELIYIKKKESRVKRDTSEDIEKIMYLEEEALRLSHQTKMLCHIIKQLSTLFWLASGPEPTLWCVYYGECAVCESFARLSRSAPFGSCGARAFRTRLVRKKTPTPPRALRTNINARGRFREAHSPNLDITC